MTVINKNHHNTYKHFLTEDECEQLSTFVLAEEEKVMAIENPYETDYVGLTKQHKVFNWLSYDTLKALNIPQRLFELPDFEDTTHIAIQCWMNVLRQTERIRMHSHGTNFFPNHEDGEDNFYACNVFLSGNTTTGTHYADIGYTPNELGEIHICHNLLDHAVPSHLFREPRISMAMDVWIGKAPTMLENAENRILEYDGSVHEPDRVIEYARPLP
jgi:hypothetical protein